MPTSRSLWRRFVRVFRRQSPGSRWVEPSNAITRAVYGGAPLATLEFWPEADAFEETVTQAALAEPLPQPAAAEVTAPAAEQKKEERPKRPGVAA